VIEKNKNYLKILNLVDIELSLLSLIYVDVVTEAVAGVHIFGMVGLEGVSLACHDPDFDLAEGSHQMT